jgi:hypothetical protein
MLKNRWPAFVYAGLFAVSVYGISFSQHPSPQNYSEKGQDCAKTKPNREAAKIGTEESIAEYTWWLAVLTGLLAIATIGMGGATIGLYVSGDRQLKLARDEFNSTHRPKIRIKHLFITNDIWQGEPIIVNLWCINTGTGDAILNEIGIRYHVVRNDRALPIEPRILGRPLGGIQLQTGLNFEIPNINIGRILTAEENADIQQGRSRLYCVGYVSYLDAAGRMRITGFCRVLNFPPNTTARIDNTRFRRFRDPDYEYED